MRKLCKLFSLRAMQTVAEFIKYVGRDKFTTETGFSAQVISRAITDNLMPSGWYVTVRDVVCAPRRLPVPEHLFRWADKRKSPSVSASSSETQ